MAGSGLGARPSGVLLVVLAVRPCGSGSGVGRRYVFGDLGRVFLERSHRPLREGGDGSMLPGGGSGRGGVTAMTIIIPADGVERSVAN